MTSRINPALERLIARYFLERRKDESFTRCQFSGVVHEDVYRDIEAILKNYADCFILYNSRHKRENFSLVCMSEVGNLMSEAVKDSDSFSLIFDKGSLTFSADQPCDGRAFEVMLSSRGVIQGDVKQLAEKYGGVLY